MLGLRRERENRIMGFFLKARRGKINGKRGEGRVKDEG
jgi:hypothetical protein